MHSGLYNALEALLVRCGEVEAQTVLGRTSISDAAYLAAIQRSGRRGGISGVARLIGVSQPTATEAVFNLERKGYAHRIVQKGARSHAILLTQEGAMMLASLVRSEEEVIGKVFSMLPQGERAVLVSLLTDALMLGAQERAEIESGPAHALVAGLLARKYSPADGFAVVDQRSSAPSLASTTWNPQAVAEAAAPWSANMHAPSSTGESAATFVRVHRDRPMRSNTPPTQNPKHIGHDSK